MRSAFLLFLGLTAATPAQAAATPSPEVWSPLRAFIGSWSGHRNGPAGSEKVARDYGSAADNQHIQITELTGRGTGIWGVVLHDAERQRLVLQRFAADGQTALLALDPAASSPTRLVFTDAEGAAARQRITFDRSGWNEFVERHEQAAPNGELTLVSETRFKRR